ncbi:MAG: PAS domain-containing protein [Gammaproteobacteria bacterium]|nr:PAS domain-containing protein [Gammaproteobacteria bacterium]
MNHEDNLNDVQLEDAFKLFNQLSMSLADSYRDLQTQVEYLSKELSEARSERLKQLAEKELLADKLEGLLDTLPAGIVVLDSQGQITQANPVAHDMLGEDLIGRAWDLLARRVLVTDGDELRLHDGRWISLCIRSLDAEPGKIILITDTTETRALQELVSRQQRLTSLGEMVASLAHQIRTPLATALLYLSNISHPQAQSADRTHFADKAKERLHHLERMVNDMLIFARGEVSDTESFSVAEFIEDFKQAQEPQIDGERIMLTIQSPGDNSRLCGNRDALFGAFQNLVNNAIEACKDTLKLNIRVFQTKNNMIEFSFEDNGCGISDDIKDRVLEPFFTTRRNGTGLGLAVVNATVSSFNGRFDIHSAPGEGSCFTITLPLSTGNQILPSEITNGVSHRLGLKNRSISVAESIEFYHQKEVNV